MTFLSVITRHLVGRGDFLAENRASLSAQTDPDYSQMLIVDDQKRGVEWANENLSRLPWYGLDSEYVMLLDDDNKVCDPEFIAALKAAAVERPGMIIWRITIPVLGEIPRPDGWQRKPQRANIDANQAAVRRDVWLKGVQAFTAAYDSDFDYLAKCYELAGDAVWLDKVYTCAMRRSLGAV